MTFHIQGQKDVSIENRLDVHYPLERSRAADIAVSTNTICLIYMHIRFAITIINTTDASTIRKIRISIVPSLLVLYPSHALFFNNVIAWHEATGRQAGRQTDEQKR